MLIRQLILLFSLLFILGCNDKSTSSDVTVSTQVYTATSTTMASRPMLVILLEFADQTFVSLDSVWQQKLFGSNTGELNDYYHEISQNQFEFAPVADQGDVANGVVKVTFTDNHPDPDINAYNFTDQLHPYLKQAIETVSTNGFDFAVYDTDGNNAISPNELIVTFIMAGEEDAYSGGTSINGIWAHQWCTETTYTPIVNGVKVMDCNANGNYAIFGERHHDSIPLSHDATVGIIAHELGHSAFNLPDLYYGGASRIGYYGLMSYGSWGQIGTQGEPGDTPTHMCAWSKIDTGWYSATHTDTMNSHYELNATGILNQYNIIKVTPSISLNEYFLLENRGINGYDAGLKLVNDTFGGGVAVWHIDEQVIQNYRANNTINWDASHKGVDLEEAAGPSVDIGIGDPTLNLYYSGNVDQFTPYTVPNTNLYDGRRSDISITNISPIAESMMLDIVNPN